MIDLTGRSFGRITVVERFGSDSRKEATWLCMCECGNEKVVRSRDLRVGVTRSCGCLHKEMVSRNFSTHKMTKTRFYRIWGDMVKRCTNPNYKQYSDYGGRGIKVIERWLVFENFMSDMYEQYLKHVNAFSDDNTTIERIDVNGDYEPSNCKWDTRINQNRNQRLRKDNTSGVRGVKKHSNGKWEASIYVNKRRVYLGVFIHFDDAVRARKDAEVLHWGNKETEAV